ncbi:hypothetical protein A6A04_16590 [Paramagnetospirillum marisnigri]|uniref:GAF domain-containing protein n=1 Tax=Paramagnetospirillum marisnigri TaxID=1285242 RepID=A0A178MQZ7_9PROT|nr:GAF domain-containing protein [Paramagnetospirillum marisnigri]OAN51268.1 hypothetical protein A6A04_16590 [Paramagnetospirillum marisnigri]
MSQAVSQLAIVDAFTPQAIRRMDPAVAWVSGPARRLRRMLRSIPGCSDICHVSLSMHEPATDMLWSFSVTEDDNEAVEVQEVDMVDVPSLVLLADQRSPRVIADLAEFSEPGRFQSANARSAGYRSCMTVPLHWEGEFLGFVMFGASAANYFDAAVRDVLDTYSEAFAILVARSLDATALRY